MEFPRDCEASGYKPVLVVLDPTPNPKLDELQRAFLASGGESYIGNSAWNHLGAVAGPTMSRFLEIYVHQPLQDLVEQTPHDLPELRIKTEADKIILEIGAEYLMIQRSFTDNVISEQGALPEDVDEGGPIP